jgi:uncharacterized protein YjiS (DUF1127 family)
MRDFVRTEAGNRQVNGPWTNTMRMVKNWRTRKAMRMFLAYDDATLHDIGLSRKTVETLVRLPLSADLLWEAERLRKIAADPALRNAAE